MFNLVALDDPMPFVSTDDARLDEALGLLEGCYWSDVRVAEGRKMLSDATDKLPEEDSRTRSQAKLTYEASILEALRVPSDIDRDERERCRDAVGSVIAAYALTLADGNDTVSTASLRKFINGKVMRQVGKLEKLLQGADFGPKDEGDPKQATVAEQARLLLQEAALQIAMERASKAIVKPFDARRSTQGMMARGQRIRRGRAAALGYQRSIVVAELAEGARIGKSLGMDHRSVAAGIQEAMAIEAGLFGGNITALLSAAVERTLASLEDGSGRRKVGAMSSWVLTWGCIELVVAFGRDVRPSETKGGTVDSLMQLIQAVAHPEGETQNETLHYNVLMSANGAWANGRSASLFCDDHREAVENTRADGIREQKLKAQREARYREEDRVFAPAPDPDDMVDDGYGQGKRGRKRKGR